MADTPAANADPLTKLVPFVSGTFREQLALRLLYSQVPEETDVHPTGTSDLVTVIQRRAANYFLWKTCPALNR